MNEEILKYIDQFVYVDQTYNDIKLSKIDTKLILDYITNLQQENEKLKQILHNITINGVEEENTSVLDLIKENERLKEIEKEHKNCTRKHWQQKCFEHSANEKIYKSIIYKAIELINKRKEEQDNGIGWVEMRTEDYFEECDEVLNILKGSDEE